MPAYGTDLSPSLPGGLPRFRRLKAAVLGVAIAVCTACGLNAQELITTKQTLETSSFTTQSGKTLKSVKIGWES